MKRAYYVATLILVAVWSFLTTGLVTDALFRHYPIDTWTIGLIAVGQTMLAMAWLTFRKWRGAGYPSVAGRYGICGAAIAGAAAVTAIGLQQFGGGVIVTAIAVSSVVPMAIFSIRDIWALLAVKPLAVDYEISPQANVNIAFPRFAVKEGEIGFNPNTKKIYRINSNGVAVDTEKWHLAEETGEYHRISKYAGGSVIFNKDTYNKRFLRYHSGAVKLQIATCYVAGTVCCVAAAALGVYLPFADEVIRGLVTFLFFFLLVGGVCCILGPRSLTEDKLVGPEPLRLKPPQNFGPQTLEAPTPSEMMDALAYKPNA